MSRDTKSPNEIYNEMSSQITTSPAQDVSAIQSLDDLIVDENSMQSELLSKFSGMSVYDSFFVWSQLTTGNHNLLLPYELVIAEVGPNGQSHTPIMRFVMPLPPSAIRKSSPVASSLGRTLQGIYEEHSGAPLRDIAINGTTGVQPLDSNSSAPTSTQSSSKLQSAVDYLFGTTVRAVNRLTDSATSAMGSISNIVTGDQTITPELLYSDMSDSILRNTGYAWFHKLSRFLDYYLAIKQTASGKRVRLLLLMHKDEEYYTVSLRGYDWTKAAGTLEYSYNLRLTAWKRHFSDPTMSSFRFPLASQTSPIVNRNAFEIVNSIRQVRNTVSDAINVLRGIRQDVSDTFIKPLKEVALLLKTTNELQMSIADLPGNLVQTLESGIKEAIAIGEQGSDSFQSKVINELAKKNIEPSSFLQGGTERSSFGQDRERYESFESRESESVIPTGSPVAQIFSDPDSFLDLLDTLEVADINMSAAVSQLIDEEIDRIQDLDADYFRRKRDTMEEFASEIANSLGGGSATYRRIKDMTPPEETYKKLTLEDVLLLSSLEEGIQSVDSIIVMLDSQEKVSDNDYAAYYAELALSNGLNFTTAQSKFWVPFPYQGSLEQLASQYLGDANRWIEIAAINGLKEPYVDEAGFVKPFLSSGSGNTLIIADKTNLFIGQKVIIESDTEIPTIRKIVDIKYISAAQTILRVDGAADLHRFSIDDNGRVRAFLPDTVNSSNYIAIPSQSMPNILPHAATNPDPENTRKLIDMALIDLKLTSEGDLAMVSSGDVLRSFGMANLVQASMIKLHTPQNAILSDPQFGNPIQVGVNTAEIDLKQAHKGLEALFLSDPRFARVPALKMHKKGPTAEIALLLGISELGTYLPVTTEVPV